MPIHDWTRLEPGDFHDFHQCWVVEIRNALPVATHLSLGDPIIPAPLEAT